MNIRSRSDTMLLGKPGVYTPWRQTIQQL